MIEIQQHLYVTLDLSQTQVRDTITCFFYYQYRKPFG